MPEEILYEAISANSGVSPKLLMLKWLDRSEKYNLSLSSDISNVQIISENLNFFTPEVKDFVYKTAHKIAASYAKKNKSELILLAKLHFILKE